MRYNAEQSSKSAIYNRPSILKHWLLSHVAFSLSIRVIKKATRSGNSKVKTEPDVSEDESDRAGNLKPGQLAPPSKSNVYRSAVNAIKAGVSPQERDLRKLRKYMGGEYTTNFKRKLSQFEERKTKHSKKVKVKKELLSASSSSNKGSR